MTDNTTNRLFGKVLEGFRSLNNSPSELWKAYALKFLDSYSYFSFSLIFTLFLSDDFGYTDVEAGTIYGAWGALITIYGLIVGCAIDNLGVARSLQVGFALSMISRLFILCTTSRATLLFNILFLLPMGSCLGIPVLTTGIRRYTTDGNRGFAFGLFYVIMNVAALLSGPIVDACTIMYKDNGELTRLSTANVEGMEPMPDETVTAWRLTGNRMVLFTGVVTNAIAVVMSFTVREIKLDQTVPKPEHGITDDTNKTKVIEFSPIKGTPWSILKETVQTKTFWRFLFVCLITLNVRMIFRHLDATLPKYMVREFGEKVPKGTIYSINPALIIVLVPIVTAATSKVDPLVMIHYGTYVSAASVFLLVMSTSVLSSVLFVIILSVGEAIWSPRLYDYTMSVVQEGREGTYMALSSAPLFLAKLPVGFLSGYLLEKYCPKEGPRESRMMWLIIALLTASSPIFLTIFWDYVSYRDPYENMKYTEMQMQGLHDGPTTEQEDSSNPRDLEE